MQKRRVLLLTWLCISALVTFAQNRTITGRVTDDNGVAIANASVMVKGTSQGVVTDADGNYTITVGANARSLVFSFISKATQEVVIGEKLVILVSLKSDEKTMEEVVVVGFDKRNRRDVAGAVGSVKAREIENLPVQSFDRAIQGKIAGVQVNSMNGIPGGAIDVKIRGVGSISAGTAPLYIVDGIQMNSGDQTRNFPSSNALAGINPDDIASIDVLKDPASASIYGAQAANGVVIITTKRGRAGRSKITYNTYFGFSEKLKKLDLLTTPEAAQLAYEAYLANGGLAAANNFLNNTLGVTDVNQLPTYDWQEAVFQRGSIQNHELSISGGNDKTTFLTSGSYNHFNGHVINTDFKRTTFRVNLDHKVNSRLSVATSFNLSNFRQRGVSGGGAFANPNRGGILIWPGNAPFNPDGSTNYNDGAGYFGAYNHNPVKVTEINLTSAINKKLQGSFSATYQILPELSFRTSFNMDYTDIKEDQYFDPRSIDGSSVNGRVIFFGTEFTDLQTDQTLSYKKLFAEKHNVSVLAGFQYRQNKNTGQNAQGTGVPIYLLSSLNATSVPVSVGSLYQDWKIAGMFLKADYIFDDRYIVGATIRRDGSSRFGKDNRWGVFPAAQLAWRISHEKFMEKTRFVDELKLRVSYGITGNALIGNYTSKSTFGLSGDYLGETGLALARLNIDNLTWEENHGLNIGLDFGLFGNRVNGSVDVFSSDRKKLLLAKPLPITSGFPSVTQNVGVLNNKGIEVSVNSVNVAGKNFRWTTDISFTKVKSEVKKLLDGQDAIGTAIRVGKPMNSIFTYKYAGVNPADGRPFYYDSVGNLVYIPVARDRYYLDGTLDPTWFGGFTNTFSYKGIELRIFFQYSGGNYLLNQDALFASRSGSTADRNQYRNQLRRWQKPGDITDVPKSYRGGTIPGANSNFFLSDRFYEKGDYLRLKELTLAYNFPKSLLGRLGIQGARFYVTGVNVLTFSDYLGYDPELVNGTTGDFGIYPQGRQTNAGLQITF
ncbi:MAG TPA: TonB-dependent receptor [Chitinophagaceae bacterium]